MLSSVKAAQEELVFVKEECTTLIDQLNRMKNVIPNDHSETFRLLCIPLLYSTWERLFTIGHSLCLRIIRDKFRTAGECPPESRALWLRHAPFFKSFVDVTRGLIELDRELGQSEKIKKMKEKTSKGIYQSTVKMIESLDEWNSLPLNADVSDLVMTYANVNQHVAELNAAIISLEKVSTFSAINFSLLDKLVGLGNVIGHGGNLKAPGEKETDELLEYTKGLISSYSNSLLEWMSMYEDSGKSETNPA